jgi:genome maintenance exonuclease 1
MQTFKHRDDIVLKDLKTKNINGKRHYITPGGNYPSVTSVTSLLSAEGIKAWRARVGEKKAQQIITESSTRGTSVHKLCENYVNNIEVPDDSGDVFKQIRGELDKHLGTIYAVEAPLYSDKLKVAGRVDLIAEWKGKLSIIDFKTANKPKKEEWIEGYFMQESAYAYMFAERMDWKEEFYPKDIVTIIGVDGKDTAQLVEKKSKDYLGRFKELRDQYEANVSKSSR